MITIGPKTDNLKWLQKIKRLLYTYRDSFAESIQDDKTTNQIDH